MRRLKRPPTFETEAQLCAAFIEWAARAGYKSYPETAGFDLLLVDRDGWQIGVEAKLRLNVRVIVQALPQYGFGTGPDYRAVLVPEMDSDLRLLCHFVGVDIFYCITRGFDRPRVRHEFARDSRYEGAELLDWNPAKRCELPDYMPDVAAGVPAPIRLTPWKIGALKVLARIEVTGWITRQQMKVLGVDSRRWCNGEEWLLPLDGDPKRGGRWARGPKCPAFDKQHPEVFAQIKAEMMAEPLPSDQQLIAWEGAA